MKVRAAALLALFYLVLPLAQAWDYLGTQTFADLLDNTNFVSSILAYNWLLLNVLIGLKIPVLQNTLPYDLRIRVHVWSTLGLVATLVWHTVYYLFLKEKFIDLVDWSLVVVFTALVVLSALWIPLPGLKTARARILSLVKSGLLASYDWLKATHKVLFFTLAGLTYWHIVAAKLIGVASPVSSLYYQALFVVTAAGFVWNRVRNLVLPSLAVASVTNEGGIVRLDLGRPGRLKYKAGQFAFLRFDRAGLRGEEHPFSFTTAAHEAGVRFAVRALGDFTAKLTQLQPGDTVRVNGGFGAFRPSRGRRPLALIGSGIGSAPLVSILKEVGYREPEREVVCLLSVNRRDELVESDALTALQATMPHLKLKLFVFEEDGLLYGPELLARELPDPRRYQYFLCSSEKVRSIVADSLRKLGVPRHAVHFEAFSLG